jgi:DNA-binding transcriptional regulator YdaS (Cro superfamily)
MNTEISPILKACQILGSQSALANAIGVSSPTVSEWVKEDRPIPITQVVKIEAITDGKVTRQELRPSDFWLIWPDLAHLKPKTPATQSTEV